MTLLEQIIAWDMNFFLFLNGFNSPFFDAVMWLVSSKLIYVPVALAVIIVLFRDRKREFIFLMAGLIVTITLCDQLAAEVFRHGFERLRPTHEPLLEGLVHTVNGHRGGQFGFVSAHAANAFGFALFTSLIFRFLPYTIVVFSWAAINSYSRIYLGVHYPLDVICGGLLGASCALLVYYLLIYLKKKITGFSPKTKMEPGRTSTGMRHSSLWVVITLILLTFFYMVVFALHMPRFMAHAPC